MGLTGLVRRPHGSEAHTRTWAGRELRDPQSEARGHCSAIGWVSAVLAGGMPPVASRPLAAADHAGDGRDTSKRRLKSTSYVVDVPSTSGKRARALFAITRTTRPSK